MSGMWIFMLIMDLLIPLIMVGLGRFFMIKPPKNINALFGYRTSMSMKNNETWYFANKYCGKLLFWIGLLMIPLSIIPLLFVLGKEIDVISIVGFVICIIQLIPLIASIIPTEIALRKTFDQDGNRKK